MRRPFIFLLAIILMGAQIAFAQDDSISTLAAGNNTFAFDLYQTIQTDEAGNFFYSPYSISQALAMTYAGAGGETAQQMADTLHFELPQEEVHPTFFAIDSSLSNRAEQAAAYEGEGQPFQLNVANSLWGQEGYPFHEAYLETLTQNYGAGLYPVDFAEAPEETRQMINDWVADETEDKIKDIIPPGGILPITRLVLANAIYFNAGWLFPFEASDTQDDVFTLLDGSQVTVPMMYQQEALSYAQGEGYQAVTMPYYGQDLAMLLIMPDEGEFEAFEETLDYETYTAILDSLMYSRLHLWMPRFEYEFDLSLVDVLTSLGMIDAFDAGAADFSGMTDAENLFLSEVLHKAFVNVNEEGTEAAAATVAFMGGGGPPDEDVEIRLDRPFIFVIYDRPTDSILFVGRVMNPAGE